MGSRMLEHGRPEETAQATGVGGAIAYKWLRRFRQDSEPGLHNRSPRPHRCPQAISAAQQVQIVKPLNVSF